MLIDTEGRRGRHYRFHLDRVSGNLAICKIAVSGAAPALDGSIEQRQLSLLHSDYSGDFVRRYAEENFIPILRAHGFIRAEVATVSVRREPSRPGCERGVGASVALQPGALYVWNGADWTGTSAIAAADLQPLLPLAVGEAANADRIERGLAAVSELYKRNGFFAARVLSEPIFEDPPSVRYAIRVIEGLQFRMGSLQIVGLPDDVASRVSRAWRLAEGMVFDATYPARFASDIREKESGALSGISEIKTGMEPVSGRPVIKVTLTFVGR